MSMSACISALPPLRRILMLMNDALHGLDTLSESLNIRYTLDLCGLAAVERPDKDFTCSVLSAPTHDRPPRATGDAVIFWRTPLSLQLMLFSYALDASRMAWRCRILFLGIG